MIHKAIVVGDLTTGKSTVITDSLFTDIDGKPVDRINNQATCPKCKGIYPPVTGDLAFESMDSLSLAMAIHWHAAAKVLSAQQLRISIENGSASTDCHDDALATCAIVNHSFFYRTGWWKWYRHFEFDDAFRNDMLGCGP